MSNPLTPPPQATEAEERQDPTPELNRLLELTVKYPEIGPPLAELAHKIGQAEFAERVMRMGLEQGAQGIEYFFVAVHSARREGRLDDVRRLAAQGVHAFAEAQPETLTKDDYQRLMHLVRQGWATLMFDQRDVAADPAWLEALSTDLPRLEAQLGQDSFYRTLRAQSLWFSDKAASEAEWETAGTLGDEELTWNARGTWYKEAERDLDRAEQAYRQGLEKVPKSALLLHNVAQVLVDKAARPEADVETARRNLREAEDLLRQALREDAPKGLRRHVHVTKDRAQEVRASLPAGDRRRERRPPREEQAPPAPPAPLPAVGDVIKGRVVSLAPYGAFVAVGSGRTGLLHKTEMAHEFVADPANVLQVGDEIEVKVLEVDDKDSGGRTRIGLSRKALLPAPAPAPQARQAPPPQQQQQPQRRDRDRDQNRDRDRPPPRRDMEDERRKQPGGWLPTGGKITSLGDLLLQKLEEAAKKKG